MCVWEEGEGEGEGEGGGERERVCVCMCVCVDEFIVECPLPLLLYTLRLGIMIRLGAL